MREVEDGKKILIIDDDKVFRFSTRIILENAGFEVEEAVSGEEGLKKAEEFNPDLFIIDLMMETWSAGFDLINKLRANDKFKTTPMIMLSSVHLQSQYDFLEVEAAKGINIVEKKPLTPDALISSYFALGARESYYLRSVQNTNSSNL